MNPRPAAEYRPALTLRKALTAWLATTVAAGAGAAGAQLTDSPLQTIKSWPALLVPLALALLKAYTNWRKHNPPRYRP